MATRHEPPVVSVMLAAPDAQAASRGMRALGVTALWDPCNRRRPAWMV